MRQTVLWINNSSNGHSPKHHLNPMCPYLELDTAAKKPVNVYPELDVCSWCEERYEKWAGCHDEITQNDCERCNATIESDLDLSYCDSCKQLIDRRQARK